MISLVGAKKQPTDVVGVNIMCRPAAAEKDKAALLGQGQKVKVVGQVMAVSSSFGGVTLDLCTFTELSPNPAPKVTAEQLAGDFSKDKAAAEKKYLTEKGYPKGVIVDGTVADLEKNKNGFYIVKLAGQDGVTVNCTVSQKTFEGLKKGDKVTMKGDVTLYDQKEKYVTVNTASLLKKG